MDHSGTPCGVEGGGDSLLSKVKETKPLTQLSQNLAGNADNTETQT